MTRALLWAPLAAFAILLAVIASGLFAPADRTVRSRLVGQTLPAFALLPAIAGTPGVVAAGDGRVRLLNVFASWCIPCAAEAPQLAALRQAGVRIEGIAIRDRPQDLAQFLRAYGNPYAAIGDDRQARVQLALGSSGVPESFVVDGRGRIVMQHVGDVRAEDVPVILAAIRAAR